jgi:hypothetical protein
MTIQPMAYIKSGTLDASKLTFAPLDKTSKYNRGGRAWNIFPMYNQKSCSILTDDIPIIKGRIPPLDSEYKTSDDKRSFLFLGFCDDMENIQKILSRQI